MSPLRFLSVLPLALAAPLAHALLLPRPILTRPVLTRPGAEPSRLGVNVHAPPKLIAGDAANAAEWSAFRALLQRLPAGMPVRVDLLFHEWAWDKALVYGFENVDAKVAALAETGHPAAFVVVPLPWPGSFGWTPIQQWGQVSPDDFDELDRRFRTFVTLLRASMKRHGMPERGTRFGVGNEPGAGHAGGDLSLPTGTWTARVGELYERMVRGTDFGGMMLTLPAPSFQDETPDRIERERATARPFLRRVAGAKTNGGAVADIHVRYYAPTESTREYAAHLLARIEQRLAFARELTGRPYAICSEFYLFREDRGANDDRAEVLKILAPKLPRGSFLYRVGPGPNDPTSEIPVRAVAAAVE